MQEKTETNLARADFYRILAIGCEEPTAENLQSIRDIGLDLLELESVAGYSQELGNALRKFLEDTNRDVHGLQAEYHHLFNTQAACPSAEGNFQMVERGPVLGDICAFYEAFHMKAMERQGPPDSIKMELGFMSFMALKTVYALENDLQEKKEIVEDAQKKFLNSHLGRWFRLFTAKLREVSGHSYYQSFSDLLTLWLEEDCRQLGITPLPFPTHEAQEDEEVCCGLGAMK